MKASGLALLGIVVTIGIVAEHCVYGVEMVHGRYRKALAMLNEMPTFFI